MEQDLFKGNKRMENAYDCLLRIQREPCGYWGQRVAESAKNAEGHILMESTRKSIRLKLQEGYYKDIKVANVHQQLETLLRITEPYSESKTGVLLAADGLAGEVASISLNGSSMNGCQQSPTEIAHGPGVSGTTASAGISHESSLPQ